MGQEAESRIITVETQGSGESRYQPCEHESVRETAEKDAVFDDEDQCLDLKHRGLIQVPQDEELCHADAPVAVFPSAWAEIRECGCDANQGQEEWPVHGARVISLHQRGLMQIGEEGDMVDMAKELFKGANDQGFLGRWKMAKAGKTVAFEMVRGAARLIGEIAVSTGAGAEDAGGGVTYEGVATMLGGGCARGGGEPGSLGWPIDAIETVIATPVALGHGAAAFGLPGMAALASLADPASRGVRGDGMYGESIVGGGGGGCSCSGTIGIHDARTSNVWVLVRDGVVI